MDAEFWRARWREGRIRFHEGHVNVYLERHAKRLSGRVLVPLCGKAEDLAWLAARGHEVVGVELIEDAVRAFFTEHGLTPSITPRDALVEYASGSLVLYAGDVFALTPALLGQVDSIYDRGALVALPSDMRRRYAAHLRTLAPGATILQVTLEYAPGAMEGPPFTVTEHDLRALYAGAVIEFLDEGPDSRPRDPPVDATERCYAMTLPAR
jgi:thiopurine S-methyltransferase